MESSLISQNSQKLLGAETTETIADIQKKVEIIHQKLKGNPDLVKSYNRLVDYADAMTSGFASTVKVIVDISMIMNAYKQLLDEVSKLLSSLAIDIHQGDNINNLKKLTQSSIVDLRQVFDKNYDSIVKFMHASTGESSKYIESLDEVRRAINRASAEGELVGGAIAADLRHIRSTI